MNTSHVVRPRTYHYWTTHELERVRFFAHAGRSLTVAADLLSHELGFAITRSQLSAVAWRNDIHFHCAEMPPWTPTQKRNHRAAMRRVWADKRRNLHHARHHKEAAD